MIKVKTLDDLLLEEVSPETGLSFKRPNIISTSIDLTNVSDKNLTKYKKHFKYGVPASDEIDILASAASNQPRSHQLVNALNNALVGEVVGGTLEGIGYLGTLFNGMTIAEDGEEAFGNWFVDTGKSLKSWTDEVTPIYRKPGSEGKFQPWSWSWWMEHIPSVASTLSLIIPSGAVVKGASILGKALGGAALLDKMGDAGRVAGWLMQGVGQAVVSRHMESMMEATGTYEQLYQDYSTQLDELGNKLYTDEQAKEAASKGAASVYSRNWAALVTDIPQYLAIGSMLKTSKGLTTKKPLNLKVEQVKKSLGLSNKAGEAQVSKYGDLFKTMASEGLEEGYQHVVQREGEYIAKKHLGIPDNSTFSERLGEYVQEGDMWNAAFFGAIGGAVFHSVGGVVNDKILNARGIQTQEQYDVDQIKKSFDHAKAIGELLELAETLDNNNAQQDAAKFALFEKMSERAMTGDVAFDSFMESMEQMYKGDREVLADVKDTGTRIKKIFQETKHENPVIRKLMGFNKFFIEENNISIRELQGRAEEVKRNRVDNNLSSLGKDILSYRSLVEGLQRNNRALEEQAKHAKKNGAVELEAELRSSIERNSKEIDKYRNSIEKKAKEYTDTDVFAKDKDILQNTSLNELAAIESAIKFMEAENRQLNKKLIEYNDPQKAKKIIENMEKYTIENAKQGKKNDIDKAETTEELESALTDTGVEEVDTAKQEALKEKEEKDSNSIVEDIDGRWGKSPALWNKERLEVAMQLEEMGLQGLSESIMAIGNKDIHDFMFENSDSIDKIEAAINSVIKKNVEAVKENVATETDKMPNTIPIEPTTQGAVSAFDAEVFESSSTGTDFAEGRASMTISRSHLIKNINGRWVVPYERDGAIKISNIFTLEIDYDYIGAKNIKNGDNLGVMVNAGMVQTGKDNYHHKLMNKGELDFILAYELFVTHKDQQGKEHVVGVLAKLDKKETDGMLDEGAYTADELALLNLRRDLYKRMKEVYPKSNIAGQKPVTINGRVKVKGLFEGKFNKSTETKVNPLDIAKDGKVLLGVSRGTTTDMSEIVTNIEGLSYSVSSRFAGKVFMFLRDRRGQLVPYMLETQPLVSNQDLLYKAVDLVKEYHRLSTELMDAKEKTDKKREVISKLKSIVHFELAHKDGITMLIRAKGFTYSFKDNESDVGIAEFLGDMVMQIDHNQINKGNYNNNMLNEGRLKTDLISTETIMPAIKLDYVVPISENLEVSPKAEEIIETEAETVYEEATEAEVEASEQQTEQQEKQQVTEDNIEDIQLTEDDENLKLMDASIPFIETWNKEEELKWFNDRFGSLIPVNTNPKDVEALFNMLVNSGKVDKMFHGVFYRAMIYISDNAAKGVLYHESIHAVIDLFLTDSQKTFLYNDMQKRYNEKNISKAEEMMSEEFREIMLTDTMPKDIGLFKSIARFFRGLYLALKMRLGFNLSVQELFDRVQSKQKFRSNKTFNLNKKIVSKSYKPKFLLENHKDMVDSLNNMFFDLLDDYVKANGGNMSVEDVIRTAGIDNLLGNINNRLKRKINATQDKELKRKLLLMYNNFLTSSEKTPEGKFKVTSGVLGIDLLKSLQQFDIRFNGKEVILNDADMVEGQQEDLISEKTVEGWQVDATKFSAKKSASLDVKILFANLKEPSGVGFLTNSLGYYKLRDSQASFNFIKGHLAGIRNSEEMFERLEKLATNKHHKWINQVIDKVKNNHNLKSKFFTTFSLADLQSIIVVESNFKGNKKLRVFSANRNNVSNMLFDLWKDNYYSLPTTGMLIKDNNPTAKGIKLADRYKEWKKEFDIMRVDTVPMDSIKRLSSMLDDAGIQIEVEELAQYNEGAYNKQNDINISPYSNFKNNINKHTDRIFEAIGKGKDLYEIDGEGGNIMAIAKVAARLRPQLSEQGHINLDGEVQQSIILPSFMSNFVNDIIRTEGTILDQYKKDILLSGFPIVQILKDNHKSLQMGLAGGVDYLGDKSVTYSSMWAKQYEYNKIALFTNNGHKDAWLVLPVLADAPQGLLLNLPKLSIDEALDNIYQGVVAEKGRIDFLKKNNTDFQHYNERGKEFVIYSFANDIKVNIRNKEEYIQAMREIFEKEYSAEKEFYEATGIMEDLDTTSKDHLQQYFYNSLFYNSQLVALTAMDLSFYKNNLDFFKRYKQIYSPKKNPDLSAVYQYKGEGELYRPKATYNYMVLKDREVAAKNLAELEEALKNVEEHKRFSILAKYGKTNYTDANGKQFMKTSDDILYRTQKINETDGQSFITIDRFKDIQISYGLWNDKFEDLYRRIKSGESIGEDVDVFLQTIKPFVFGHYIENVEGQEVVYPLQFKNSETVIIPQLWKQSKYLSGLLDHMEINDIQTLHFESVVKAAKKNYPEHDNYKEGKIEIGLQEHYGFQQENPAKFEDVDNLFGSQARMLIFGDMVKEIMYKGKSTETNTLFKRYMSLLSEDQRRALESTLTSMGVEFDSDYNLSKNNETDSKIRNFLLNEINTGRVNRGNEILKYLELDEAGQFKIGLYDPRIARLTEQILNSIFRNRVTKQRINGSSLVQTSNIGFSEKLDMIYKDGALVGIEVMLPAFYKDKFKEFMNEKNELDIERIKKEYPEALELIGYRIPTEGKYSMLPLIVKDFSPKVGGGTIIMPSEILRMTGSDFDIDKMYVMIPNFNVIKEGKLLERLQKEVGISEEMFNSLSDLQTQKYRLYEEILTQQELVELLKVSSLLEYSSDFVFNTEKQEAEFKELVGRYASLEEQVDRLIDTMGLQKENESYYKRELRSIKVSEKERSDNEKIDIMRAILTSKDSLEDMMNPGGFELYVQYAKDIENMVSKDKREVNPMYPKDNRDIFTENRGGGDMIGIFANHVRNHALTQNTFLALTEPVQFNGARKHAFNGRDAINNELISRNINRFLAAVVDTSKNPVMERLGVNVYNANYVSMMVRLGYSPLDIFKLLNTPILKELSEKYFNHGKDFVAEQKAIDDLFSRIRKKEGQLSMWGNIGEDMMEYVYNYDISINEIEDLIKGKVTGKLSVKNETGDSVSVDKESFLNYAILSQFLKNKTKAESLAKFVEVTRADTKGTDISMAGNNKFLDNVQEVLEDKNLEGQKDIIEGNQYPLVKSSILYGVRLPNDTLSLYLPFANESFIAARDSIQDGMKRKLTVREQEEINYAFLGFITLQFPNLAKKKRNELINNFPDEFRAWVKKNPEIATNPLIARLQEFKTKGAKFPRIEFSNTGLLTGQEKDMIVDGWLDMLKSEKYSEMALSLIEYAILTSAFTFSPHGFSQFIPAEAFTNYLIDENGISLSERIKGYIESSAIGMDKHIIKNFTRQFLRNNYSKKYMPTVDNKKASNISETIKTEGKYVSYVTGYKVNGAKVTRKDFVKKDSETGALVFVPFIRSYSNGVIKIFELKNVSDEVATYEITSKLGYSGWITEYSFNEWNMESSLHMNTAQLQALKQEEVREEAEAIPKDMVDELNDVPWFSEEELAMQRQQIQKDSKPNMSLSDKFAMQFQKESVQESQTEEEQQPEDNGISNFTNHSGGAIGSDIQWDTIGREYGMVNNNHYWTGTKTPNGNIEISKEDYQEGRFESAKAAKRNFGYQYDTMKDSRLIRNWSQVKHSDAIFAIGKIVKIGEKLFPNQTNDTRIAQTPSVTGGTGYTVGMSINNNKPTYVFNQVDGSYNIGWYKWDNTINDFIKIETPTLTKDFAGIGTREINEVGKQAIRDVYKKATQSETTTTQPTVDTTVDTPVQPSSNIQNFTIKKDDKSNWSLSIRNGEVYDNNTNTKLDPVKDERLINKVMVKEAHKNNRYSSFDYNTGIINDSDVAIEGDSKYAAIITINNEFKIVSLSESNLGGEVFKQGTDQFKRIIDEEDSIAELYRKYCKI